MSQINCPKPISHRHGRHFLLCLRLRRMYCFHDRMHFSISALYFLATYAHTIRRFCVPGKCLCSQFFVCGTVINHFTHFTSYSKKMKTSTNETKIHMQYKGNAVQFLFSLTASVSQRVPFVGMIILGVCRPNPGTMGGPPPIVIGAVFGPQRYH